MELYARRRGWPVGEVEVDYMPATRGCPTRCGVVVRLPEGLPPEQRERLMQVGVKSQVHRTLEGEIVCDERVELTPPRPKLTPALPAEIADDASAQPPRWRDVLRGRLRVRPRPG